MKRSAERGPARVPDASGTIWYMGAKTRLLPLLEGAISPLLAPRRGRGRAPCLVDLFAGTGVVGAQFADRARIVAGDAQRYATVLARALLVPAPRLERRLAGVLRAGAEEAQALLTPHAAVVAEERGFLAAAKGRRDVVLPYRRFLEEELRTQRPEAELESGGGLLLSCYRNVYFGVEQAAHLDGLRRAIEREREPERSALLAALLFAASRATSGTAHFAQPRGLRKPSEVKALLGRRSIDVRELFTARARHLAGATASLAHPAENEARQGTDEALLRSLAPGSVDVVYADPPYTLDHYSRFYHVLETLAAGAVPVLAKDARGALLRGRYPLRSERFTSRFCSPETVAGEFRRVGRQAAALGASLVWSYSRTNGLLVRRLGGDMEAFRRILLESHASVRIEEHALRHSGAGDKNHAAIEVVAVCTMPRAAPAPSRRPRERAPARPAPGERRSPSPGGKLNALLGTTTSAGGASPQTGTGEAPCAS